MGKMRKIISSLLCMVLVLCGFTNLNLGTIKAAENDTTVKVYEVGVDQLPYTDEELYKQLFDINNTVDVDVDMSNAEMAKLDADYTKFDQKGSKSPIYRMADVTIKITLPDGTSNAYLLKQTGVRMKGNTTRNTFYDSTSNSVYDLIHMKFSFQETFDKADDGYTANEYYLTDETAANTNNVSAWDKDARKIRKNRTFAGLEKIDVKWNGNYDNTYLREYYAYEMFRSQGIMAPHMNLSTMEFGDKTADNRYNLGVYSIHECVDETFLNKNLAETDQGGDLYKAGWAYVEKIFGYSGANFTANTSYGISDEGVAEGSTPTDYNYDLKTNKKTSDNSALTNMINVLGTAGLKKEDFAKVVDADQFVKYAAVAYFLGNPDDLRNNFNNYYVYFYPSTSAKAGQAFIIPYDFDRCLGVTVGYNPDGTGMTEFSPYSNTGAAQRADNPIYSKSVASGGFLVNEYKAALEEVYNSDIFTTAAFQKSFDIVNAKYSTSAAISDNIKLVGTNKPKFTGEERIKRFYFSMDDDEATENYSSSTSNITVDNYIKAIKNYYEEEKNAVITEPGCYIQSSLTNWKPSPDYKMTFDSKTNTYSYTWKVTSEVIFSIVNPDGDVFRYNSINGTVPSGVSTNFTGSIILAPGSYKLVFNDTTKKLSITDPNAPASVKIVMNANGGKIGSSLSKSKTVNYGSKLGTLQVPKRAKYIFSGWYTKKTGGTKVTASTVCKYKSTTNLYAHWTKVAVAKTKITKITNSAAGTITVIYNKVSGAAGYEVTYSNNSKFSKAKKIVSTSKTVKIKKLSKRTTYYVKVRAYKKDSTGAKVYSSPVIKTIKITK